MLEERCDAMFNQVNNPPYSIFSTINIHHNGVVGCGATKRQGSRHTSELPDTPVL